MARPHQTRPVSSLIERAVEDIPGWTPLDQLYTLASLAIHTSDLDGDIVEIGSWCGRSTVALAIGARIAGHGKVIAIDLFPERNDWHRNSDDSYSLRVNLEGYRVDAYTEQTVWKEPFYRDIAPLYEKNESIRDLFDASVAHAGVKDLVSPMRGTSAQLKENVAQGFKCRLAFIDGDHSYEAVCRDISNIEPFLVPGGWICFDDAFSHYAGVNRAIQDRIISSPTYDISQQMTRKLFIARKSAESR